MTIETGSNEDKKLLMRLKDKYFRNGMMAKPIILVS